MIGKSKSNSIEVLISKALIYSNMCHPEVVLTNNVLKEYYGTKKEIKRSNNKEKLKLYRKQCFLYA